MSLAGVTVAHATAAAAVLSGCGGSDASTTRLGTVTVFAASSLNRAFTELGERFQLLHPGTSVRFSFAGSPTVVAQVSQGAPADVVATADRVTMDRLVSDGLTARAPEIFAHNALEIVVAAGNPKSITRLADLARPDVTTVLCAASVPCGSYSRRALDAARVRAHPVSDEQNVTAVIGRIASGEADAGIVYVTDVIDDPRINGVAIPDELNVTAAYPIAVIRGSEHSALAEMFVAFVRSAPGQAIITSHGFMAK
jgi:molybdate transport system substrate-binding protein